MASRPMDLHQPVRILGYSYVISDLFNRGREEELHFALRGSFCHVCEGLFFEMNIALVEAAEGWNQTRLGSGDRQRLSDVER